jgi:hypothetical protein
MGNRILIDVKILNLVEYYVLVLDVESLKFHVLQADFRKYSADCFTYV